MLRPQIGPQLVSLELDKARIIKDATFRDMVRRFKNMRSLSLNGTFYVKSQAINALAMAGRQLQKVGGWLAMWGMWYVGWRWGREELIITRLLRRRDFSHNFGGI